MAFRSWLPSPGEGKAERAVSMMRTPRDEANPSRGVSRHQAHENAHNQSIVLLLHVSATRTTNPTITSTCLDD
jgi:hypothetical protein